MRPFLTLALLCAAILVAGSALAQRVVSPHGEFVLWAPTTPTHTYATSDLPQAFKVREREAGSPYADALLQFEVELGEDGAIRQTMTQVRYYLTQNAVQRSGNLTFWVDSFSDVGTVDQAYTLLPDGRRLDVDPDSIQVIPEIRDDIFSDAYEVIVPFFGLEKDAIAVLVTTTEQKPGVWPLPWSRVYFPRTFVPRLDFRFHLTWDEGVPSPLWQTDDPDLVCDTPSARTFECRATDIPVFPDDPHVYYRDVLPSLVVAEPAQWDELAGTVGGFVDDAITDDSAFDAALDRILAGAESVRERLARIHRFVSQDVRYIGLEQGLGGIIPRPASQTLASRFGDCKDKTTLFIALARRAGMDAYPVLTTFSRFDPDKLLLPGTAYFDHMVACVRLGPSEEYCVDLTDPYNGYDTLSSSLNGAIRFDLVAAPAAPGAFRTSPFAWIVDVTSDIDYRDNGDIAEHQTRTYDGPYAGNLRSAMLSRDRYQRREWLLEQYHGSVSDRVDPEFELHRLEDVEAPLTIESTVLYENTFDPDDPSDITEFQGWLSYEARSLRTGNSHHGYRFSGLRYTERTTYRLPLDRQVRHVGAQVAFDSPFGRFTRTSRRSGSVLNVVTELSIPSAEIAPGDVDAFNRFIGHVNENARIVFSAEPP